MARAISWTASMSRVLAGILVSVLTWRLRKGCRRQGARGKEFTAWFDKERERVRSETNWLLHDANWQAIASACGALALAPIMEKLEPESRKFDIRKLFLTALSTVSTYEETWRLVLAFSTGEDHKRFLEIRALEDRINDVVSLEFRLAKYLLRGMSIRELIAVLNEEILPGPRYSFVSLTTVALQALTYALRSQQTYRRPHVVVVLDADMARRLGTMPALYALASTALDLQPHEEGVNRAFPLDNAHETQVHFDVTWPPKARSLLMAVVPVGASGAGGLEALDLRGIATLTPEDLL